MEKDSSYEDEFEQYSRFYDTNAPIIYGIILKMTKEETFAQKVLTQSFIKIWSERHLYHATSNKAWMLTIAISCAFQELNSINKEIFSERRDELLTSIESNKL